MDLRVDDHDEPVEELARLVRLRQAYTELQGAGPVMTLGVDEEARRHTLEALRLAPEEGQIRLYAGLMHARAGEWMEALPLLRSAVEEEPRWPEALRRMAAVDRLPADLVAEIEAKLAMAGRSTGRSSF
jgi:tetratricopeptide (TPR) repeat protein